MFTSPVASRSPQSSSDGPYVGCGLGKSDGAADAWDAVGGVLSGALDGRCVGTSDGMRVGKAECGLTDGACDGALLVGVEDGAWEGIVVVGMTLGAVDGMKLGPRVGVVDGSVVG